MLSVKASSRTTANRLLGRCAVLGHFEELVLVVLGNIEREATTVEIHDAMVSKLPHVSLGSVYVTLDRLLKRELVVRRKGAALPERGGKAQYYYLITDEARDLVLRARQERTAIGPLRPASSPKIPNPSRQPP